MSGTDNKSNSYHIFIFPFKWDAVTGKKSGDKTDLNDRISLENFNKLLKNPEWHETVFKINTPPDYNEYIYFYDFAREVLFAEDKNSGTIKQYQYKLNPGKTPVYKIKLADNAEPYELPIEKILLTTYFTGVGILSFYVVNDKYPDFEDILRINEFGRRIYPQFLGKDGCLTEGAKNCFLADSLEVYIDDTVKFKEDFSYFDTMEKVTANPHMLSHTIMGLLGNSFYTGELDKGEEGISISPILDDRMFVLCWLADKSLCCKLAKYDTDNESYGYAVNDAWFKLIFIDKESPSCNSIPMKKKLLTEHTYDRWVGTDWSSLFGVTRYSFIILNDNSETFVKDHLKTMYLRMVQLALAQRASILRFSGEAARIADMKETVTTSEKVSALQKKYLQFINKIYFREITAFDQGIELYEKITQVMKIERDIKQLDQEIEELHHYASFQEEKKKNKLLSTITILGLLFLIPGLISGFFGMNLFSSQLEINAPGRLLVIVLVMAITFLISWGLIIKNHKLNKYVKGFLVLIEVLIIGMLLFGCLFSFFGV